MFDLFFKSQIRSTLLRIFFNNPENVYYIRELAQMAGFSAGNVNRELKKMEKTGIFKSAKKGNLRFYCINKKHPLINELKTIVSKTIGIDIELKKAIIKIKNLKFAFIFGSYVKGDFEYDSDIDLFLIGDKINEDEVIKIIKKVENQIQREINFHIAGYDDFFKNLKKKYFYQEILNKYILLTENGDEFTSLIRQS